MIIKKVGQHLRWNYLQKAYALGLKRHGSALSQPRMLCYHGLSPKPLPKLNARFISPQNLEAQLDLMEKYCKLVFAKDFPGDKMAKLRPEFCISFDDGYKSLYKYLIPILERRQIPVMLYVTSSEMLGYPILWTDLLDILQYTQPALIQDWAGGHGLPQTIPALRMAIRQGGRKWILSFLKELLPFAKFMEEPEWDDFWKLMDAKEIAEAAGLPWVTIGAHTALHADLKFLDDAELRTECLDAKTWLEAQIGHSVEDFAFPFGSYSHELVPKMKEFGFERLGCMDLEPGSPKSDLPCFTRIGNHPGLSPAVQFAEFIRGSYV